LEPGRLGPAQRLLRLGLWVKSEHRSTYAWALVADLRTHTSYTLLAYQLLSPITRATSNLCPWLFQDSALSRKQAC
jgi:hypothetical protein